MPLCFFLSKLIAQTKWMLYTAELQWLEHLWNHENMVESKVVRAIEC